METKKKKGIFFLQLDYANDDVGQLIVSRNGESGTWDKIRSNSFLYPKNSDGENQYLSRSSISPWTYNFSPVASKNWNIPLKVILKMDKHITSSENESVEGRVNVLFEHI